MTFFLPWKCEDERHGYEACQYAEYVLCFALPPNNDRKRPWNCWLVRPVG